MAETHDRVASSFSGDSNQFDRSEIYAKTSIQDWSRPTTNDYGTSGNAANDQLPAANIQKGSDGELLGISFDSLFKTAATGDSRSKSTDNQSRTSSGLDTSIAGSEAMSKGAKPRGQEVASHKPVVEGLNDDRWSRLRENATYEQIQKAHAIKEALMSGKNVSEMINKLDRNERDRVMAVVKGELADENRTIVSTNEDGSKDFMFVTKNGSKIRISEDHMGTPTDIMVNGKGFGVLSLRTMGGAVDVYDRPGEDKKAPQSTGGGNPIRDLLLGKDTEGNGPLARYARGEELSPEDMRSLEELSRKPGSRVIFLRPRSKDD